jgi:xylulokinase
MSYLAVDVGMTGAKAIVVNQEGKLLRRTYTGYQRDYKKNILREIDPNHIWKGVKKVVQACRCSRLRDPVRAIAVSVSGDDFFPAAKNGYPLANVISAYQTTGIEYEDFIIEKFGGEKKIFETTGQPIRGNVYPLHRLLWIKNHQPEIYDRTWKFLCWEEYITYLLTGECISDHSLVSRTLLFDVNRRKWSEKLIKKVGLDGDKFPAAFSPGTVIGKVKRKVAEELNLPLNCLVATGGFDQATASLGAGVVRPGNFSLSMGTVVASHWLIDKRNAVPQDYSYCCSLVGTKYLGFFHSLNGCAVPNWFFRECGRQQNGKPDGEIPYDYYNRRIAAEKPSALFFLPHLAGAAQPYNDPISKGALLGICLSTTAVDIVQAIYEGIAFDAKRNYESLRKDNRPPEKIMATGGGSRSDAWMQLMANIIGCSVFTLRNDEGSALGAAMLAAYADKSFQSVEEVAEAWIKPQREFSPNETGRSAFADKYRQYLGMYRSVKPYNDFVGEKP